MEDTLFGRLAVAYGYLTTEDLDRCLKLQATSPGRMQLGEVLVQEGFLGKEQLNRLLTYQQRRLSLSEVPSSATRLTRGAAQVQKGTLEGLLELQKELDALQLVLASGARPFVRLFGGMVDLGLPPLTDERCRELVAPVLDAKKLAELAAKRSLELIHVDAQGRRFRVDAFLHRLGIGVEFKLIQDRPRTPESLALPKLVTKVPELSHGLVLVTGPRACGKSTTLAAIVELINRSQARHVITIERPIEVIYESRRSLIAQREVGRDAQSFASALRSSLREDPDVIVVSEIDDVEEITTALTAAETGHLVLATMQTSNAYRTILRILDAYTGAERDFIRTMLSGSLRVIISQQLVPNAAGDGQVLAAELLTVNSAICNMIREDRIHHIPSVMQTSRQEDMILMDDALLQLVKAGQISAGEALARAEDQDKFVHLVPKKR